MYSVVIEYRAVIKSDILASKLRDAASKYGANVSDSYGTENLDRANLIDDFQTRGSAKSFIKNAKKIIGRNFVDSQILKEDE